MTMTQERPVSEFLRPRRLSHDEYYTLADAGFFDEQNVELLDGEVWRLPPQTPLHVYCIHQGIDVLKAAFETGFDFRQRGPLVVSEFTEPEPDILVVPGSCRDYADHHPSPSEARLLLEVADEGTLAKDRGKKRFIYAEARIADYWIVNLVSRQLEVYRNPITAADGYAYDAPLILTDGDRIAPLAAPNGSVAVADLFPPLSTQTP